MNATTDFIDLQINGYAGIDFNSENLTAADLRKACERLKADGVQSILLTLITDSVGSLRRKIANVIEICERDSFIGQIIQGLHIEGPYISPVKGFVGAHPVKHAKLADLDEMSLLLEAGQGQIKVVTLAPEMDPKQLLTRRLTDAGIIVAAGHTDATRDQLQAAIDVGLCMFTHLGNGCPHEMNRHDNIITRTLSLADQLWISFIADGAHIPFFALNSYLKVTGLDRIVIVTDAIAAAGAEPGIYHIGGRGVEVGDDGVPRSDDGTHLVGSATTMQRMVANLREELFLDEEQIRLITRDNPRKLLASALHSAAT